MPLNVEIVNNKDGTNNIYYTVKQPDEYKVSVKFGGQLIPNGEWLVYVSIIFLFQSFENLR